MAELNDETITSMLQDKESSDNLFDALVGKSPLKSDNLRNNLTLDTGSSTDDDGDGAVKSVRRRTKQFSDSESEVEADKENIEKKGSPGEASKLVSSDSEDDIFPHKSGIVSNNSSNDDNWPMTDSARIEKRNKPQVDNDSSDEDNTPSKTKTARKSVQKSRLLISKDSSDYDNSSPKIESARISHKRSKPHNKFKSLLTSRSKEAEIRKSPPKSSKNKDDDSSDDSTSENECNKQYNKQDLQSQTNVCDPDTSTDEEEMEQRKKQPKQRASILISPKKISKPARMSAKQAMENMQKIKSESNRMLREKEVSLPYHRPKALSLKDIMSRRKPALSADGKVLPLKMNSEQLKQYVKQLEQRNKEMMELCKSESEEEENVTEETAANDIKEPENQSTNDDEKEHLYANIVEKKQNEEKQEENIVPAVNENEECSEKEKSNENIDCIEKVGSNENEESNENDLPELTIETVPKEQNTSNTLIDGEHDVNIKDTSDVITEESETNIKLATGIESQLMELRYESEKMQNMNDTDNALNLECLADKGNKKTNNTNDDSINDDIIKKRLVIQNTTVSDIDKTIEENINESKEVDDDFDDDFSDVDINMEDLDSIIENARNNESAVDSPMLIRDPYNLNKKPKLTGAPGMVIDLDGSNPVGPRKLTGVELLKERFTYFAKLKTPEEKERERELKIKPGMLHIKLKQDLEEKINEQRSLEWAKRLEEEKQKQDEMNAIRGDESDGDDLEKIEAKLQDKEDVEESSSESEEEEEDTCEIKEKPRKRNYMIDDEAEVSGDDETGNDEKLTYEDEADENETEGVNEHDSEDGDDDSESSEESSEDEEENQSKPRKGRILKAFEDSDDEGTAIHTPADETKTEVNDLESQVKDSQDDLLPLAQVNKSHSEDLFASQSSSVLPSTCPNNSNGDANNILYDDCADMTTQSFSILNTNTSEPSKIDNIFSIPAVDIICDTQPGDDTNLDDVVGMCSGKFAQTQNVIPAESQVPESQCAIGEDILELCTGKFYDNQFVSLADMPENAEMPKENVTIATEKSPNNKPQDKDLLESILKDMDEPVKEPNKTKYVFDNPTENEAVSFEVVNHVRKKFTIDSDDENADASKPAKKKKLKKRKLEKRALQISDDEEEEHLKSDEEAVEYMSGADEDDGAERIVEYDSEENEVEVKPEKQKKTRKMAEFFEQEAELTSEDEWVGSGDEDERGLDRMEREEGDDDTFHQGRLQRELGQIHMRDILDQDKREVRLIQELLFEDGDLGDGHRQRKFRWKDLDGEADTGAVPDLFAESQEEEFESEEQWRKQRHEREVFLRSLKEKQTAEQYKNISLDRTAIVKTNLCSKTMSSLLLEANGATMEETSAEKKIVEPSNPSRSLPVFQQNYHGSLLTRGRGALARLAALAMPLAGEADDESQHARGPSSKRNFVFAAVTPPAKDAKAPKRKADNVNVSTPRLIKKLKTDDKRQLPKASLLDHLKAL